MDFKNTQRQEQERLECGHVFHKTCIDQWAKYKPTCPLCRAKSISLLSINQWGPNRKTQILTVVTIVSFSVLGLVLGAGTQYEREVGRMPMLENTAIILFITAFLSLIGTAISVFNT